MANKDLEEGINKGKTLVGSVPPSIWYVVGIVGLGWIVYRSGYESGVDVSNRMLRRHDKDVKRMKKEAEKREKNLRKELKPEEEQKKWKWWPFGD